MVDTIVDHKFLLNFEAIQIIIHVISFNNIRCDDICLFSSLTEYT